MSTMSDSPQTTQPDRPVVVMTTDDLHGAGADHIRTAERRARFDRHVVPELDFVHRTCRRFSRTAADAEDLAQEVLTNAYRAADRFDGRYPRAWLYRIASNAAASRARRHKNTVPLGDDRGDGDDLLRSDVDVEADVLFEMLDPALSDALESLPEHYRSVIDLVDVDQLSYDAAAEELGVPTGTVMSRLHRGRRHLRERLENTHLDRARLRSSGAPV